MSNQFTIQAGLPLQGAVEVTAPPRGTAPAAVHTAAPHPPAQGAAQAGAQAAAPKPVALFVNPSFRFDPTTGFVVIEFHNANGTVSNTIPSQRQLEAYRTHQETPPSESTPPTNAGDGTTAAG